MSDFAGFSADLSRTELGLGPLNISDHVNYSLGDELLGGTVSWRRQTVKSPYVEGEYTVNRARGIVEERVTVECLGADSYSLQRNIAALIEAIGQARFVLTIRTDAAVYGYDCEAADYTVGWEKSRRMSFRATVALIVRRQPVLLNGGF